MLGFNPYVSLFLKGNQMDNTMKDITDEFSLRDTISIGSTDSFVSAAEVYWTICLTVLIIMHLRYSMVVFKSHRTKCLDKCIQIHRYVKINCNCMTFKHYKYA